MKPRTKSERRAMLRRRPPKATEWVAVLGRPLSAAEVEAWLGLVKPCSGYVLAVLHNKVGNPQLNEDGKIHVPLRNARGNETPGIAGLHGWWEGPRGEFSRRPYLDAVWDLAVERELQRKVGP